MLAELRPGPDPAGLVLETTDVTIDPAIIAAWHRILDQAKTLIGHTFNKGYSVGRTTQIILSRGSLYLATDCLIHGKKWRLATRVPNHRWQLAGHHDRGQ